MQSLNSATSCSAHNVILGSGAVLVWPTVDTDTISSHVPTDDSAMQVESVKELSHKQVVENAAIFHRGKDDRVRQLWGPRVAGLASCTSKRDCSSDTRDKCMRLRTNNKKKSQSDTGVYLNDACMKSYSHGLVCTGRPDELHANHEPVLEEIIPTFRTPPGKIRLGSFLISIKSGERLLF